MWYFEQYHQDFEAVSSLIMTLYHQSERGDAFNFFLFNKLLNNGLMTSISHYFSLTIQQKETF